MVHGGVFFQHQKCATQPGTPKSTSTTTRVPLLQIAQVVQISAAKNISKFGVFLGTGT
jgi:hypothetical protein